jgi:RHS repeat-associated protein
MKFTGHERDRNGESAADDLDYMHARYYSPRLGRFLSVDVVQGKSKIPQTWNRYSYARGNPILFTDPDGRFEGAQIRMDIENREFLASGRAPSFTDPSLQKAGLTAALIAVPGVDDLAFAAIGVASRLGILGRLGGVARKIFSRGSRAADAMGEAVELSKEARKSVRSLRKQAEAHRQRLADFKSNPEAFDNKEFLKNAPSEEIRQRIIDTRIRNLERQIQNFEKQIEEIISGATE